jgi:hypothetical protein
MSLVTQPVAKPKPADEPYSTVALELFARGVTREVYAKEEGKPAPPFDYNLPVKRWADKTADPSKPYAFRVLDKKNLVLVWRSIPGTQAVEFNLPGLYEYPSWKPEPDNVKIRVLATGALIEGVEVSRLAMKEQADALLKEISSAFSLAGIAANCIVRERVLDGTAFEYVYPADEKRRVWVISVTFGGGEAAEFNAGMLLKEKYRAGVGAPGNWQAAGTGGGRGVVWVSKIPPVLNWNDLPETPIPLCELRENEELFAQFGGNIGVRSKKPVAPSAGGFTEEDRSVLRAVSSDLKTLGDKLGQILG